MLFYHEIKLFITKVLVIFGIFITQNKMLFLYNSCLIVVENVEKPINKSLFLKINLRFYCLKHAETKTYFRVKKVIVEQQTGRDWQRG